MPAQEFNRLHDFFFPPKSDTRLLSTAQEVHRNTMQSRLSSQREPSCKVATQSSSKATRQVVTEVSSIVTQSRVVSFSSIADKDAVSKNY